MNSISRVLVLLLVLGCFNKLRSQGFEGFPVSEFKAVVATQGALPDQKLMLDKYIAESIPSFVDSLEAKSAIILVPANGCSFCSSHCLDFFTRNHLIFSSLKLIQGGIGEQRLELGSANYAIDSSSAYRNFGFELSFPVVGLLENSKTVRIIHIDSQVIEEQFRQIIEFLGN